MDPRFFATPKAWHEWLQKHHDKHTELLVGFHKKDSGRASITWPESVDGALCFGWIDGVRRRIDEVSYSIRFTPRKASSTWSAVNIKRVAELIELSMMHPAGLKAFEARTEQRSAIYAYEQEHVEFDEAQLRQFKAHQVAWKFFQSTSNTYRKVSTWWVVKAKREETRVKRLAILMEASERGETLAPFTR